VPLDDIASIDSNGNIRVWVATGSSFKFAGIWGRISFPASVVNMTHVIGVFAGNFTGSNSFDEIAIVYGFANSVFIHVKANSGGWRFEHPRQWWIRNNYFPEDILGRIVAGDFNGDGRTDLAAIHCDGFVNGHRNMSIHVWQSNGNSFTHQIRHIHNQYNANAVTGRVVAGDFNGDGRDDIAAFYYYSSINETAIHMFLSTGTSFDYSGDNNGWWRQPFNANSITGRVVAGDFTNSGRAGIAAMRCNGDGTNSGQIWLSHQQPLGSFVFNDHVWGSGSSYDLNAITNRMVAGRFNDDELYDFAAFYNYGINANHRIHVFLAQTNPPRFDYQGNAGWGEV
jgi:hypothetical protein